MANQPRKLEFQEQFRNAGNENVIQQAGEGQGSQAPKPVPGQRLTTAEMRAERGHPPQDDTRTVAGNYDPARPDTEESDALRVQHSGDAGIDTDTNDQRGDQVRARVEGLIGNPD